MTTTPTGRYDHDPTYRPSDQGDDGPKAESPQANAAFEGKTARDHAKEPDEHKDTNFLVRVWQEFSSDNGFRLAAAMAYYTVFSLPALLVISVSVAGFFVEGDAVKERVANEVKSVTDSGGSELVMTMLEKGAETGGSWWAVAVGIVVLLVGASSTFGQLQAALNEVWEVKPDPETTTWKYFVTKRLLSIGMVLSVAFLLIASLMLTAVVQSLSDSVIPGDAPPWVANVVINAATLVPVTLLFAAMYKVLPDAEVSWTDTWVGAAFAGVLFVIAKFGLGYYIGTSNPASAYGAAGSLILILLWIYYTAVIFLLGAEFTQVWARRHGDGIIPEEGAVRVIEKTEHVKA